MIGERTAAAVLERSAERELWLRRELAAEVRGYERGRAAGYEEGYAASEREMAQCWHEIADPIACGGPSYAELERRRWMLRGEQRTRKTFGQPHADDFLGGGAE